MPTNTKNNPGLELPPAIPSVSMDIELGEHLKPGQTIEFDYGKFYDVAKERGLSEEAIEDLNIDIIERYRGESQGSYYSEKDSSQPVVEIGFNVLLPFLSMRRSNRSVNGTLAHETEHYIDAVAGRLPTETTKAYQEAATPHNLIHTLAVVANIGALATDRKVLTLLSLPSAVKTGKYYKNYWRDASEVRARKAARKYKKSNIITVQ